MINKIHCEDCIQTIKRMAESDIKSFGINNINGLNYEGTYFYRDRSLPVALEHTGFTDTERIQNGMKKLGYRNTTGKDLLFRYYTGLGFYSYSCSKENQK